MSVRWIVSVFVSAFAFVSMAMGQISVGLKVENAAVLQYEPLRATVTVLNNAGEPLVIGDKGEGTAYLRFVIQREDDRYVHRGNDSPWMRGEKVGVGERREMSLDLARWFDVSTAGAYKIVCDVEWNGVRYEATPVNVDVVKGMPIAMVQAGVVGDEGRVRTYGLKYWSRGRYEHLFLVVEEPASGMNYGVYDLGMLIRVFQPKVVVEGNGRVRITHQSAPRRYTQTVFDSRKDEVRFVDQTHHLENGTPYPSEDPQPAPKPELPAAAAAPKKNPRK